MSADLQRPLPLRGPIGIGQLLFTRRTAPMVGLLPARMAPRVGVAALALLLAIPVWFVVQEFPGYVGEFLWAAFAISALVSEGLFGLVGAGGTRAQISRWKRSRRLAELHLTLLRPVTVGQLILAHGLRHVALFVGILYLGFAVALLAHHPSHALFLVPFAVVAVNAIVTAHTTAWAQLPISLGLGRGVRAFFALSHWTGVFTLCLLPLVLVVTVISIALFYWLDEATPSRSEQEISAVFQCLVPVFALPLWGLKLLFARAFAARLEQVVFPQMEH